MKLLRPFYLMLIGITVAQFGQAQEYCIPPGFQDMGGSGEPFTYISNVQLENLNNSSGMPTGIGDDNGYTHYNNLLNPILMQGNGYELKVSSMDNLGSGMEVVVWIDWNGDKIFHASGERVAHWALQGDHGVTINVPTNVPDGIVRMRIYCDMPPSMGHIPAEPCGYLNHPDHPIGQHGEVEDYDIQIGTPLGISSPDKLSKVKLYPNPAKDVLNLEFDNNENPEYKIIDVFGRLIKAGTLHNSSINVSDLKTGQYVVLLQWESEADRQIFNVLH